MAMEAQKKVAGCCGEIEVMVPDKKDDGSQFSLYENFIMQAQYVEYKLAHYIDKSSESLFGFISVLPGAFSVF